MAAGSGLTAGLDLNVTNQLIALTGSTKVSDLNAGGGNWWGLCTNQLTAAAKTVATGVEWLASSDTAHMPAKLWVQQGLVGQSRHTPVVLGWFLRTPTH